MKTASISTGLREEKKSDGDRYETSVEPISTPKDIVRASQLVYREYVAEDIISKRPSQTYFSEKWVRDGACEVGSFVKSSRNQTLVGHGVVIPDDPKGELPADEDKNFAIHLDALRNTELETSEGIVNPSMFEGGGFVTDWKMAGMKRLKTRMFCIRVIIERLFRWIKRKGATHLVQVYHPRHERLWKRAGFKYVAGVDDYKMLHRGEAKGTYEPRAGILGIVNLEELNLVDDKLPLFPLGKRNHTPALDILKENVRVEIGTLLAELAHETDPEEIVRRKKYIEQRWPNVSSRDWNDAISF